MSTFISAVQALTTGISIMDAIQILLGAVLALAMLLLFKPLLRGIARALLLVVKPKLTKEERLQRRLMKDAMMLNRMLNAMEDAPSHAAELRAMAARA
ncbi:hypothetical protein ASC94_19800 [Massilia sp. Root418]|nr:hypothetical protein ASC94_19800 [Massilia sp. Root418]